MSRELWIDAYESLVEKYMDDGLSEEDAERKAEENAGAEMFDRLADHADYLRKKAKEG